VARQFSVSSLATGNHVGGRKESPGQERGTDPARASGKTVPRTLRPRPESSVGVTGKHSIAYVYVRPPIEMGNRLVNTIGTYPWEGPISEVITEMLSRTPMEMRGRAPFRKLGRRGGGPKGPRGNRGIRNEARSVLQSRKAFP
jgi:hypothetical protein